MKQEFKAGDKVYYHNKVPFCNRTGKIIIDYIDGEIVTE